MKKLIAISATVVLASAAAMYGYSAVNQAPPENPKHNPLLPNDAEDVVEREMAIWSETPYPYASRLVQYEPEGHYLNGGVSSLCQPIDGRRLLDDRGIAMMIVEGVPYYHPVLSAQCGLNAYTVHLTGDDADASQEVLAYADHLIELQDERGAFPYPFPFYYYLTREELPLGWTSGMAQGQALSLFARAYHLSPDSRYLEAGQDALTYLTTPVDDGGVMADLGALHPTWSGHVIFEEYVVDPPSYTLNGFLFALFGLYDWASLTEAKGYGKDVAARFFKEGVKSAELILPYFDLEGMTAYDLGYITHDAPRTHSAARYHGVHIVQLHALESITGSPVIGYWQDRWQSYVSPDDIHAEGE